jgi:transcriptional regulator with XRE-family HTH domain
MTTDGADDQPKRGQRAPKIARARDRQQAPLVSAEDNRRSGDCDRVNARPGKRTYTCRPPALGPQGMVRQVSGTQPWGRPDPAETAELRETLGAELTRLRRERGLSGYALARRTGVHRSTVLRLERGERRPRPSTLGWLAWTLAGAEQSDALKQQLCALAGDSLISESRWSAERAARKAMRQVKAGAMELPPWLAAPWCVAILGSVLPDQLGKLERAQELARAGQYTWPAAARRSDEAYRLAAELDECTTFELAGIGRGMLAAQQAEIKRKRQATSERADRLRARLRAEIAADRAELARRPRPRRLPKGVPESERWIVEGALAIGGTSSRRGAR